VLSSCTSAQLQLRKRRRWLPHTFILAMLLNKVGTLQILMAADGVAASGTPEYDGLVHEMWHNSDERLLVVSRKALMLCDARWRAGTLFTPTPEERVFSAEAIVPAQVYVMPLYFAHAANALQFWPPPRTAAEDNARLRAVHGALCAALEMDARGYFKRRPDTGQPWADTQDGVMVAGSLRTTLLTLLLFSITHDNNVRRRLRGCGMSEADEAALVALRRRIAGEAPILDADARKMINRAK
jgi:hypothetical protein